MKLTVFLVPLMMCMQAAIGFDGFYVGGSLGAGAALETQEGSVSSAFSQSFMSQSKDLGADSFEGHWDGSLFLGYGLTCNKVYLGLEGFVRYANPSTHIFNQSALFNEDVVNNTRVNTHVEVGPWHYGLDARFGWFFAPCTLVYGRFGAEWTEVDFESNGRYSGFFSDVSSWDLGLPLHQNKRDAFFRFGGGIEQRVSPCLSFRLDYVYTNYRNFDVQGSAIVLNTGGEIAVSILENNHAHLADHAVTLGVSYFFSKWRPNLDECCFCPSFRGFYAFGALGGSLLNASIKGDSRVVADFPFIGDNVLPNQPSSFLVDRAFLGLGALGYGYRLKCAYLGLELFAQYSELTRDRTDLNTFIAFPGEDPADRFVLNRKVKTRTEVNPWQFGIQLRPGFFLTPSTLIFGTVGTSYAKIKASSAWDAFFQNGNSSSTLQLFLNSKAHKEVATLRLGGGVEYAFSSCWHLRADYLYTDYDTLRLGGSSSGTVGIGTANLIEASRFDLHTHAVTLGAVKYF